MNSETCILKSENDFTRDGYKLIGWSWGSVSSRFSYKVGDTFKFTYPHNGDTYDFYAIWQDIEKPIFVGLENEKTYCKSVKFKVTDNGGIASVKVGDTTLAADSDGYYTINYHNGQDFASVDYTVTATDLDGNTTTVSITLRSLHAMSTWGGDGEHVWRTCGYCGEPDDTKYKIPVNCIVGDDTVCRNEDYKFTVTLPSEWYFGECDFTPQLQDDGTYLCVVDNDGESDTLNISFELYLNPGDSHPYNMRVDKTVTVVDHTGGTANCKDKAVCTECGNPYGETDPKNHKYDLERLEAKPATVEEVGNIEYWYCSACDKYYSDKDGNTELSKDEVTLKKLAPEIIEGKGQKISFGESCDLTFRSNAAIADFIRVEIDGVTIDENNYTVKSGSIVVALKGEYVASLSAGEHIIGIVSTGGTATATFTVEAVNNPDDSIPNIPATYGFSNVWLWTAVMFVSGGCLLTELYFRKKPNCNKK